MIYSGEITSLADLHKVSQAAASNSIKLSGSFQYYRGHGCSCYKLLSYISRFFSEIKPLQEVEEEIINDLKRKTEDARKQEYFYLPQNSNGFHEDWYCLTQAQHLGIPTRLMDWTLSSEIALYFAVSDKSCQKKDGDLWVFFVPDDFNIYNYNGHNGNVSSIKPFQADKDLFINIPVKWSNNYVRNEPQRNMVSQQGKFFIRTLANSLVPLEDEAIYQKNLLRYKVPSNHKEHLFQELTNLNYSHETIYKTIDRTMEQIKDKLIETYNLKKDKCSS